MTARHVVRRAGDATFPTPAKFVGHSNGFGRWDIVGESDAVHTGFGICEITGDGDVEWHVHSYEVSWYVIEGEVVLETDDGTFLLRPGDYGVLSVGAPHSWRGAGAGAGRWAEMCAPQPRADRDDTFFQPGRSPSTQRLTVDPRDPRVRSLGHIDERNMEVDKQTQRDLALSASMRTALLVYSGITVKMMVDTDLGADLSSMFMVQYEPDGKAGAHDHPLEETYFVLEGEVDATFDGETYRLGVGDVAWAGVGCVHEFANPGEGIVRWLETQAPQPPSRHSYRFARDWQYLRELLDRD